MPPGTTQNTNFPTDTTERSTTASEQGTTESSSQQQTTVERRATTSEEEETTTSSSFSSSGQGVNAGDFAAIALGIVILIAIISVVAGVIAYKMKLCGGARKKGMEVCVCVCVYTECNIHEGNMMENKQYMEINDYSLQIITKI